MAVGLDINSANIKAGHETAVDYPTNASGVANCTANGTNADAVVTLNNNQFTGTGQRWNIGNVFYSYAGGTLTGGRLLIQDTTNSETLLDLDVTSSAKDFIFYTPSLRCKPNATITVTLKAGSANVVGKVNVHAWFLA
jgi:hypothetical protein